MDLRGCALVMTRIVFLFCEDDQLDDFTHDEGSKWDIKCIYFEIDPIYDTKYEHEPNRGIQVKFFEGCQ